MRGFQGWCAALHCFILCLFCFLYMWQIIQKQPIKLTVNSQFGVGSGSSVMSCRALILHSPGMLLSGSSHV